MDMQATDAIRNDRMGQNPQGLLNAPNGKDPYTSANGGENMINKERLLSIIQNEPWN